MSVSRERWFPRPMGRVSARIKGAANALRQWGDSAYAASKRSDESEEFRAAMRGKAAAYREAAQLVEAIHNGTRIPRRWGGDKRRKADA